MVNYSGGIAKPYSTVYFGKHPFQKKQPKDSASPSNPSVLKQQDDAVTFSTLDKPNQVSPQAAIFKESLSLINQSASAAEAYNKIDAYLKKNAIPTKAGFIELHNPDDNSTLRFLKGKNNGNQDQYLSWLSFSNPETPELDYTLSQFKFPPEPDEDNNPNLLNFERPGITEDRIKLSAIYLNATQKEDPKNKETQIELKPEVIQLYAGHDFLITVSETENKILKKAGFHLSESGKYKSPAEMVSVLLQNVIQHNTQSIHAFSKQLDSMSHQIAESEQFKSESITRFAELGKQLFEVNNTILSQKAIVEDLLENNEFYQSSMIDNNRYEQLLLKLNQQLETLEHYQEHKNGLINLERAKASNQMDQSMKRLAAISTVSIPPLAVAGFLGMNVIIPGSGLPWLFWAAVGGSSVASGGVFAFLKKKKWI